MDLLKYQYNEIEEAKLEAGEEERLEEREKVLLNSEKIINNLEEAHYILNNNVVDELRNCYKRLRKNW